ncbi:hypothetical protein F511_22070 [Dorcoceras hygrometricum]|uniref:Dystroglycan-like n=1 Tax=Dorcoceras hygrometricum TaxID=472368 RepID=A0A2Z7DJM0_9LAMI|nr:hypothetical protein F511_22070 [Dorcoceras hygrometricum]
MASAYYSNTQHIDFESVLAMDDPGMVSMFQAIMASGLEGFLGCPAVIYEAALVDFFENASVQDGVIISTVAGQLVEISEEWFAESFDLPVDGLADLSEIPKDVIFDARSIVSMSGEPMSLSGKKSQLKIEYRLLCDIMAKSISVKAGSFNAITVEKFSMLTAVFCGVRMNWASVLFNILKKMVTPGSKQAKGFAVQISLLLENIPNLELGESSEFPSSKILTEKTVHRYVSLNDKVGAEEAAGAPKPKAASKKRPAIVLRDEPVVKKKRTMKKKSSSSKVNLEIVAVAQEVVPIQMVEPTTAAPAAEDIFSQPAVEDEIPADPTTDEVAGEAVDEEAADECAYEETADGDAARVNEPASEPAVADIVNEEPSTADDVDIIIEQVLADTAQIRVDQDDQIVRTSGEGNQPAGTAEERQWFDIPYDDLIARWDAERMVTTLSDTDEEIETESAVGTADGVQTESSQSEYIVEEPDDMEMSDDERSVDELIDADEKMSLDEIILTIPAERLRELKQQAIAHRIQWDRPCCSILFEGRLTSHHVIPAYAIFEFLVSVNMTTLSLSVVREIHQELNAKVTSLEEQVAATRHDLLDFSAQAQQTLNVITDQLSELVAYINHGDNDKKGEVSSSRPPPDVLNKGSGNTGGGGDIVRTIDITQRDIDNAQRNILERLMSADRARERERRTVDLFGGIQQMEDSSAVGTISRWFVFSVWTFQR